MGIFKKIEQSKDLREDGRHGRARILGTKLLNRGELQVSRARAEQLVSGEATMTTMRLELEVSVDGRSPYRVKVEQPVPTMEFTRMVAGSEVGVLVDPGDRKRVEVDWSAAISEPSLEERAEHDPTLKALLDRRVDPDG